MQRYTTYVIKYISYIENIAIMNPKDVVWLKELTSICLPAFLKITNAEWTKQKTIDNNRTTAGEQGKHNLSGKCCFSVNNGFLF